MIQNPAGIIAVLILIEGVVLFLSENPRLERFFKFPPALFWIYFLPMLASAVGLIPRDSEIYSKITITLLPAGLVLLLVSTDIPSILRLGKMALVMMSVGTLGIVMGAPLTVAVLKPWLPADAWSGFGALSASWIGGSSNMIAVKEAIGTPDAVFFPMIVVDTVVAYSWMGFLILLAGFQDKIDRWTRADRSRLSELASKDLGASSFSKRIDPKSLFLVLAAGFGGAWISQSIAEIFFNGAFIGVIILASTLGITWSFTTLRYLGERGAPRIGYLLLFFVLTSIGARANLAGIFSSPVFILGGFLMVAFHGSLLLLLAKMFRVPLGLVAAASQANIGGPASAPIVGAAYAPCLAPVGLLLGILGNVLGTYLGLLTSLFCKWVS